MVHQSFLRRRSGWGSCLAFPHWGKTYHKTVLNDLSRKYWMPCYNRRRSPSMSNKFQHPTWIWNTTTAIDTKTFLPNSANLSGSISHGNLFLNSDMETLNELITSWERACIDYDAATRPILRAIRQEIARHDDVELIIDALSKSFSMNWHWCLLRRVDRVRRRTTDQKYIPPRPGLGRPRSKRRRRNWCRWLWHGFRRQRCRVRQRNWAIENINHPNSPLPFFQTTH